VVGLTDVFKPLAERRGLYRPSGAAPAKPFAFGTQPKLAMMAGH
jgi:chemotaxis protein methyltransferase CheR